jgi:hypothetical protein
MIVDDRSAVARVSTNRPGRRTGKSRSAARHQADPADEGAGPGAGMVVAQLCG